MKLEFANDTKPLWLIGTVTCFGKYTAEVLLSSLLLSLTAQKKPVRLIFACPVKSCRTFCANEAAFEAHFDAHLENRITGKIGDYFRRTPIATTDDYMVNGASIARHPQQQSCRRHVKSTSSLVDLNIDALGDISLPPMSPTMGPHITASNNNQISGDPDFSARTSPAKFDSPSTPIGNLDGNCLLTFFFI